MDFESSIELAKKLISLPSYVSDTQDEILAIEFLEAYIQTNLPELVVERQVIVEGSPRCNLIVRGKGEPKLLVLGHIDTVQPKDGWQTDPLVPVIRDGNLYGLGAADMKGSLAAFVWALVQNKSDIVLDDLMLLVYVDEEYDFKGMLCIVGNESLTKLKPTMTLSLDGDLAVATGCRGVIELKLTVQGKSGHASNPRNGINAITETTLALVEVGKELEKFTDDYLGPATMNIAYLQGGTTQKDTDGNTTWLQAGNVIADTAEVILEVRTPLANLSAKSIVQIIKQRLKARGLMLRQFVTRHDIRPWQVVYDKELLTLLEEVYAEIETSFLLADRSLRGYIDAAMIAERVAAPAFIIGTGGTNRHGANENTSIKNIEIAANIYGALLKKVLSK